MKTQLRGTGRERAFRISLLLIHTLALLANTSPLAAQNTQTPSQRGNVIQASAMVALSQIVSIGEEALLYADSVAALDIRELRKPEKIGPPGWGIYILSELIESSDTRAHDLDRMSEKQNRPRFSLIFTAN